MRRARILVGCLFLIVSGSLFADAYAVLPVETIGYRTDRAGLFYSAFVGSLREYGHDVLDYASVERLLEAQQFNLSLTVNRDGDRLQAGQLLEVSHIVAVTVIWNGEFNLLDVRITHVESGGVLFQKIYTTDSSPEAMVVSGIPFIVADIHDDAPTASIFSRATRVSRSTLTSNILGFARSTGAVAIAIVHLDADELASETYYELIDSGEYAFIYNLRRYYVSGTSLRLDDNEWSGRHPANYRVPMHILRDPESVVVYFGTRADGSFMLKMLSREARARCWHAVVVE